MMTILGWTLVHSLWQIALIFIVFKGISYFYKEKSRVVYRLACVAIGSCLGWSMLTFIDLADPKTPEITKSEILESAYIASMPTDTNQVVTANMEYSWYEQSIDWVHQSSFFLGMIWVVAVVILLLRLFGGYFLMLRLRHQAIEVGLDFQSHCETLSKQVGIGRHIALLECPNIGEPMTLGFWRPVILFPVGLLLQLSPPQLESVLLHELAHIRRYDYLVNLLQMLLDVLFFYHPLFRLLSREARVLREYCCDDFVLDQISDNILYARTLTAIKINNIHIQNQFIMTATTNGSFTRRMVRIANMPNQDTQKQSNPWLILLILGGLLAVAMGPSASAAKSEAPIYASADIVTMVQVGTEDLDSIPRKKNEASNSGVVVANMIQQTVNTVAVEPVKMNVMYIGVDNPLRIVAANVPMNELVVKLVGNGTLTGEGGNYIATVAMPGTVTIEVYKRLKDGDYLIASTPFRVKRIPDPRPKITNLPFGRGIIEPDSLKNILEVELVLENFLLDATCEVVNYEMTVLPRGGEPYTYVCYGGKISDDAKAAIARLGVGGCIFIDDIKGRCPGDAAPRNVGQLAFKIK